MLATVAVATLAMPRIARSAGGREAQRAGGFLALGHACGLAPGIRKRMVPRRNAGGRRADGRGSATRCSSSMRARWLSADPGGIARPGAGCGCSGPQFRRLVPPYRPGRDHRHGRALPDGGGPPRQEHPRLRRQPVVPFIDAWLRSGGLDRNTVNLMLVDPGRLVGHLCRAAGRRAAVHPGLRPARGGQGPTVPSDARRAGRHRLSQLWPDRDGGHAANQGRCVEAAGRRAAACVDHNPGGGIEDGVAAMLAPAAGRQAGPGDGAEQIRLSLDFFGYACNRRQAPRLAGRAGLAGGAAGHADAGLVKPGWRLPTTTPTT